MLACSRRCRMLSHFKIVWRLVYGLLNAGQTIFSTTALIAVFLFIFSCVAMEVIAKDPDLRENPNTRQLVQDHFFGINKAFITLLQFVTLDNVAEVYYPLIFAKPWLCVYFFPILIFISIGLMNLVTAALVENAMQAAAIEAEEERMKLKAKVRSVWDSAVARAKRELVLMCQMSQMSESKRPSLNVDVKAIRKFGFWRGLAVLGRDLPRARQGS